MNCDILRVLNMNAISVRAQSGRANGDRINGDIPAHVKPEVELRTVLDFHSADCYV